MILAMLLAMTWVMSSAAQSTQTSTTEPAGKSATVEDNSAKLGSVMKGKGIVGKLTKNVGTKQSKVGDAVEVEVTQDAKVGDQVLVRKGSTVKGTITGVQGFSKGKSGAELDMVFDNVSGKGGEQASTHLIIYALAADVPQQPDDIYNSGGRQRLATSASISGGLEGGPHGGGLTPETVGIFGFDSLELHPLARTDPPTSAINSSSGNIVLGKATKIVLVFVGQ
ncbi:MAG: hypothetical protein WBR26_25880 [Candidatus Acidiferrum sp.]